MKKFLITFSMILVCCLTLVSCVSAHETAGPADILYDLGLFKGTGTSSDGSPEFSLERAPSREEAITMLVRLLGADSAALTENNVSPFTDVSSWAKPYVGYAYANGLSRGTSSTTFGSDSDATAAQYISFVLRALGYSSEKDFNWDCAWKLSDTIGLTHGEYSLGSIFTRQDVAKISLSALYQSMADSSTTMAAKLCKSGAIADEALARRLLGDSAFTVSATASSLQVHFIDVGQADSSLLICDGHAMLIDGGNAADSSLIYSYLKAQNINKLDFIVCTHAHEDHVGGLSGALSYAAADKALSPVKTYSSDPFSNFVNALEKQGKVITVPKAGGTFTLGSANVEVLAPQDTYSDVNNSSIVLRISHGKSSFLFMGDAELESENDILDSGSSVKSTVIKVGHHGSESSSSYRLLYEAQASYAVISCGKNNQYGHPDEAVMSRLRDAEIKVYRTDMQGTIICTSDGSNLSFTTERNANADTNPKKNTETSPTGSYIGNKTSMKFHLPTCRSLPNEVNRVYFSSRYEAASAGYEPCKICKP